MSDPTHSIVTSLDCQPISDRNMDWSAWFDFDDDPETQTRGFGETEKAAVLELLTNAGEADDDGSFIEEIVNMALGYWIGRQS